MEMELVRDILICMGWASRRKRKQIITRVGIGLTDDRLDKAGTGSQHRSNEEFEFDAGAPRWLVFPGPGIRTSGKFPVESRAHNSQKLK